jgi:hypothetical protein
MFDPVIGMLETSMMTSMDTLVYQEKRGEIVNTATHLIDLDADPFVPNGWGVVEHRRGGQFEWSPEKVRLYLSPSQMDRKVILGFKLRKELVNESVLNANVLDYLVANPHLIPEEWKGKAIFFWGTIYRRPDGRLRVRCLYWDGSRWDWRCGWLSGDWGGNVPALVS